MVIFSLLEQLSVDTGKLVILNNPLPPPTPLNKLINNENNGRHAYMYKQECTFKPYDSNIL